MRLSDLLGKPVVDEAGEGLGVVHDVAAVQDGPVVGAFGAALRVEALLVGVHGLWSRLGIDVRTRRATDEVPWDDVLRVEDDRIVVRVEKTAAVR